MLTISKRFFNSPGREAGDRAAEDVISLIDLDSGDPAACSLEFHPRLRFDGCVVGVPSGATVHVVSQTTDCRLNPLANSRCSMSTM
jgi:hypothetical protein